MSGTAPRHVGLRLAFLLPGRPAPWTAALPYLTTVAVPATLPRPAFEHLFRQELGLSDAEYALLLEHFTVKQVPRRAFLLHAGDIAHAKAYVNSGCSRSYVLDSKGKEHVLFFGFEDWWLADFESYTTGKPGRQFIQAIEDLELLVVSRDDFDRLAERIPALGKWHTLRERRMTFSMIDRLIEVKTFTPEERIRKLMRAMPQVFQRVALQDIASFLDIEPGSLSRLRKRMVEAERGS